MSSLRQFVEFLIEEGWAHESLRKACFSIKVTSAEREWYYPEDLHPFVEAVTNDPTIDPYDKFVFFLSRETGRPDPRT